MKYYTVTMLTSYTHQQNRFPLAHSTLIPALLGTSPSTPWLLLATILGGRCTTPSHSTWGHHFVVRLVSTKVLISNVVYFVCSSLETSLSITDWKQYYESRYVWNTTVAYRWNRPKAFSSRTLNVVTTSIFDANFQITIATVLTFIQCTICSVIFQGKNFHS